MMSGPAFVALIALLAGAAPPAAGDTALPSATGKVELEGALTANDLKPPVGNVISVYFNVTPLVRVPSLELRLKLSPALEPVAGNDALSRSFGEVEPGRTVTLSAAVRVMRRGEQTVTGSAHLVERGSLAQARPFLLELNPAPAREPKAARGVNQKGEKLIIYEEERPAAPPPHPPADRR